MKRPPLRWLGEIQEGRLFTNEELLAEIAVLREALEFSRTTINHALWNDHCGKGCTKWMCETAMKKANEALGDEE